MTKLKSELIKENEMLLSRLNKLEKLINNKNENNNEIISMTKIIKVVSLYNGTLNLKTSSSSDSVIFKFNFFGDEQPIFYNDLVKCISTQQRFFKDGFCMILDEEVVRAHYLVDDYKNLLTKEEILNFLDFSENEMTDKYNRLPNQQKITVLEVIARKVNENKMIDRNKVDIISKISGQNIIKLAEKIK
jgi:hypothetical protein